MFWVKIKDKINNSKKERFENIYFVEDENRDKKKYSYGAKSGAKNYALLIVLFSIILLFLAGTYYALFTLDDGVEKTNENMVSVGNYEDLLDKDYQIVEEHFRSLGFSNIVMNDLNDSGILFWKSEKVSEVEIDGKTKFNSKDRFDLNSKIVISYH